MRVSRSSLAACFWALAWAWVFASPGARPAAAEEQFAHGDYEVVRWTTRDGLPSNVVRALAQTPDGFLWIGTWGGLGRFDGVRFETFDTASTPELEATDINALAVDREGTLWIGTFGGAVCTYRAGRFRTVRSRPTERAQLRVIAVASDGAVWVGGRHLARYDGRAVREVLGLGVWGMHPDPNGDLWVANWGGVHQVRGDRVVHSDPAIRPAYGFSSEPNGTFLAHGTQGLGRYPGGEVVAGNPDPRLRTWQLWGSTLDGKGSRWWAVQSGLYRLPPTTPDSTPLEWSQMQRTLPLAVTGPARAVIEARDGSIWVGTEGKGLMRLTPRVGRVLPIAQASSVVPLADGSVWVADPSAARVVRLKGDQLLEASTGLRHPHISPARGGGIWIAHKEGYARLRAGALEHFERPAGRGPPRAPIFEDRGGRLWWWDGRESACIANGRVTRVIEARVWGERRDGSLLVKPPGRRGWGWMGPAGVETHPDLPRMPSLNLRSLVEDSDGRVWVGHPGEGLSCFHDDGLAVLTTAHGLPANLLGSIVEDDQRRLWINSIRGVFVATLDDLASVAEGRSRRVPCRLVSHQEMSYRASAFGPDGRLYASTVEGYVVIDTRTLDPMPAPPVARVQSVLVGERSLAPERRVELALGERSLRIRYTAPALDDGEFLRFHYRLVGVNPNWVESEGERAATYFDLAPGEYEFQVRAQGTGGAWGEAAAVTFVLPPRIDETAWFRALVAALLLGAGAWVYRLTARSRRRRTRTLVAELERHRAEEVSRRLGRRLVTAQEDERARIALELHDDISQRLAVLVLRLGTQPEDIEANQKLGQDIAGDVHRISHALHPARLEQSGLAAALRILAREARERGGIDVEILTPHDVDDLSEEAALGLYRIGQEALNNALQHGKPRKVAISICPDGPDVYLGIEDDGVGYDAAEVGTTGLGLLGMAERARALGGTLDVESTPGTGTRVLARVPRRRSDP